MAFGFTVAACATSISLRTTTAFSVYPSTLSNRLIWPEHTVVSSKTQRSYHPSLFIMSASTSSDTENSTVDIASNISSVKQRMDDAISSNERPAGSVRLVAVSKTKPIELLQAAYEVR